MLLFELLSNPQVTCSPSKPMILGMEGPQMSTSNRATYKHNARNLLGLCFFCGYAVLTKIEIKQHKLVDTILHFYICVRVTIYNLYTIVLHINILIIFIVVTEFILIYIHIHMCV